MKFKVKFKQPRNKEEKLIRELCDSLNEAMVSYIKLNKSNCSTEEIFITLRDGVLAFSGLTIDALKNIMDDKSQIPIFLKECQYIFNCYIEQAINE